MTPGKPNLVLGFCTGYGFAVIESFIASALACSAGAQLCLFTRNLDEEFYQTAARHGIRIEDAGPYLDLGTHPQNARWLAFRDFLRQHGHAYGRVLLTDIRDVFFQSDPFAIRHPLPVCFALEDTKIMWEPINQAWVRDLYGADVLAAIAHNHVACAGTTIGTCDGILDYLDMLCSELQLRSYDRAKVYDQGVHNVIVWSLRPAWGWVDTADTIVNTVGCTSADRIQLVDGIVVIDGKVPPVIHQWDRHEMLRDHVAGSLQFKVPR